MSTHTDSVPRVSVQDLFIALKLFQEEETATLEELRLRICLARKAKRRGDYLFPTAVNVAVELQKLGLVAPGPLPKATSRAHEASKNKTIRATEAGTAMLATFMRDKAEAFDSVFGLMFAAHKPLRSFVAVLLDRPLLAPLATSVKDHVGTSYSSASVLASAVAKGRFDVAEPLRLLAQRMKRDLTGAEREEISQGLRTLAEESKLSAAGDDATEFAKNFLGKFNEVIIPAVFRGVGLPFDYRSHRALWSLGEEFKLWDTITGHPEHDGTVIYRTATIRLTEDGEGVAALVFDSGLLKTRENFLGKLFAAYQKLQARGRSSHVNALELRAVFCLDNSCQVSVFNALLQDNYTGNDAFTPHFELLQKKPPRKKDQIRAGKRLIGSVLITRGAQ
ncbi:MAG: hypothetical protein K2V38_28485 [Gemmataceae bacterium]|nr:hypothetical protein [Gemmataceae bacterium]